LELKQSKAVTNSTEFHKTSKNVMQMLLLDIITTCYLSNKQKRNFEYWTLRRRNSCNSYINSRGML